MVAKTGAARRRAFFKALEETGNQTLAAERARVSRSWAAKLRAADPAFRAATDEAIARAKARLDRAVALRPDRAWRTQDGEVLTVRGCNGRLTQIARAGLQKWTPGLEERFLRTLAASCNVKLASAAAGLSATSAYRHRRRWPAFAERWDAAVEEGYDRLATALVAAAGAMLGDDEMVPEAPMEGMTVGEAIRIMGLHQRRAIGLGHRPGRPHRVRSFDELRPSILAKLELVKRASRAEAALAERAGRRGSGKNGS